MSCRPAHNFNSRPSARGDFPPFCRPSLINYFNSRPSARGDPSLRPNSATLANYFNSRPSARGDYRRNFRCDAPPLFQFTPLREGRRLGWGLRPFALGISIHAPPRGATYHMEHQHYNHVISIHAPPRGATGCAQATKDSCFISIHAPPRGATIHPRHVLDPEQFQFTPLREGRRQRPATPPWE